MLQCPFEEDLMDAVASGRWPHGAGTELRHHVEGCELCRDVEAIAAAFLEDRDCAWNEAPVPSASAVWWRTQMRAREEAARLAARPIIIAQATATVCVFAASVALAPAAFDSVRRWIAAFGATASSVPPDVSLSWIVGAAAYTTLPLLAVGLWLVLAPVVVFLALDD